LTYPLVKMTHIEIGCNNPSLVTVTQLHKLKGPIIIGCVNQAHSGIITHLQRLF